MSKPRTDKSIGNIKHPEINVLDIQFYHLHGERTDYLSVVTTGQLFSKIQIPDSFLTPQLPMTEPAG